MRRTLILIAFCTTLAACGGGEEDSSYIRAMIDGSMWSAEASEGEVVYLVDGPDGIVSVASRTVGGGSQIFSVVLPNPPGLGTTSLDGSAAHAAYSTCPNVDLADCASWVAIASDPGILTITRIEPNTGLIEGGFAFRGHLLGQPVGPTKTISSGWFVVYAPSVFILE
ncbi:MAG: hypothetical protein ABIQ41_00130 [Gemmatimonadales bacterium]